MNQAAEFTGISMLAIPLGIVVYAVASNYNEDSNSMSSLLMLANVQIPLPAVVLMLALSFILGRYLGALSESASFENKHTRPQHAKFISDISIDSALKKSLVVNHKGQNEMQLHQHDERVTPPTMSTARYILHHLGYTGKRVQKVKAKLNTDKISLNDIESRLKPTKIKFSSGFMKHLLTYNDFTKRAAPPIASTSFVHEESTPKSTIIHAVKDTKIGHVILNNATETSFDEEGFAYIVEPMCTLRGMDMFLTDVPEVLLTKSDSGS